MLLAFAVGQLAWVR